MSLKCLKRRKIGGTCSHSISIHNYSNSLNNTVCWAENSSKTVLLKLCTANPCSRSCNPCCSRNITKNSKIRVAQGQYRTLKKPCSIEDRVAWGSVARGVAVFPAKIWILKSRFWDQEAIKMILIKIQGDWVTHGILSKVILIAKTMRKKNFKIQMLAGNSLKICLVASFEISTTLVHTFLYMLRLFSLILIFLFSDLTSDQTEV